MKRETSKAKKTVVIVMLALLTFTGTLGMSPFTPAKEARAQLVVNDPVLGGFKVSELTLSQIAKISANIAIVAVLNASQYFLQKLAYDAATYAASAGTGQKPVWQTDGFGDYVKNTAADAAGEALGTIQGAGFEQLGINLCSPSRPDISLNIKLGFLNGLPGLLGGPVSSGQPQPRCSWRSISDGWEEFANQDTEEVLDNIGVMFTPGQSSLSTALEFNSYSVDLINKRQQQAIDNYIAKSGFKDKLSSVSGKVLTPAENIKTKLAQTEETASTESRRTASVYSAAAIGQGVTGVLSAAVSTFVNTLAEKGMKRIFERGLISLQDILGGESAEDPRFNFEGAPTAGGRAAAELANADLLTPKIFTTSNFNELTEFSLCPEEGRTVSNCTMDSQFVTAVTRSSHGAPMTVRQAVDQGFLNGNWRLLPPTHPRNQDKNCYRNAFCHGNLVKLRKARIIPIGWEMAASSRFNDQNDPATLAEVMDRFNDCPVTADGTVNESKLPDPLHPWCRLIDPDWILKYPEAICLQQAPGSQLIAPQGNQRSNTCVDSVSCIQEGSDGTCVGGFGYCVREKSYWQIEGDTCPAYFASCQSVTRADGAQLNYLMNTTQVDVCNADNAGCRQYGRVMNAVTNSGFEDTLSGDVRGWSGGSSHDRSGRNAIRGASSMRVDAGDALSQQVAVLPQSSYTFAASALSVDGSPGGVARVSVTFSDRDGFAVPDTAIGDTGLTTTCQTDVAEEEAFFEILTTDLGYTTAGCDVTSPEGAVAAEVVITVSDDDLYVDEIGLVGDSFSDDPHDNIFLNAKAETCDSGDAGCTELVRASTGTLNLIRNPGFETPTQDDLLPLFWSMDPSRYDNNLFNGFEGVSSITLEDTTPAVQVVPGLLSNATYSFSLHTRYGGATPASAPDAEAVLTIVDSEGDDVAPVTTSSNCGPAGTPFVLPLATGGEYQRSVCQFSTPDDATALRVELRSDSDAEPVLADAVQLELAVNVTPYHDGYSSSAQRVNLKIAPPGLNCTGSSADPAECGAFAPFCRRDQVGCNLFTPVGGGTPVPAVTNAGDTCPSECVGYETFRQEPTDFFDEEFPLFFIPSTAQSCSASEAGCEEFTNLSTLAEGGEAREYFSSLRLCTEPNELTSTFYTWEGSEDQGFQLRTWRFMRSNLETDPTGDGGSDPTGGRAPCTSIEYDDNGVASCNEDASGDNTASCSRVEMLFNPDCREFYDTEGNIHYRQMSEVILATDECDEYRMTRTDETACRNHGGFWTGGTCHYFAYAPGSRTCRPSSNGCRAYTGNAARNVRIVVNDTFESGTTDGWTAAPGGGASSQVENSNESVTAGGHSLRSTNDRIHKDVSGSVREGRSYTLSFWAKGVGDLSAFLSSAGDEPFTFNRITGQNELAQLTTEWRSYTVGPVNVISPPARGSDPADNEQLIFEISGGGATLFIDNIELREVAESIYVVKDSWNTSASCDQTPEGAAAPQFMLGCRAYTDRRDVQVNLKSFTRLCSEDAVGCEAMYHTQNSASPFGQTFNAVCTLDPASPETDAQGRCDPSGGRTTCACAVESATVCQVTAGSTTCQYDTEELVEPILSSDDPVNGHVSPDGDTVRVPDDRIIYVINDDAFSCDAEAKGCTVFGDRTYDQDQVVITEWAREARLDLPDDYQDILCTEEENFCQAYNRVVDGAPLYFKDPGNHVCEYKENVNHDGFNVSGWFKKGLDEPCYSDFLQAGNLFGIWKNSDPLYDGWVGECASAFDQCKEFIDPRDTTEANPDGQPYYLIMNDQLDTTSCQGRVSLKTAPRSADAASACVLFDRTDDLRKRFNTEASYAASDAQGGGLEDAVSVPGSNDANVVIRVQRDRRCSEWLSCRSSETVFNPTTGDFVNVCTGFGLCTQFSGQGDESRCVRFEESEYSGEVLTQSVYQSRSVSFEGQEFSGYAIPGLYPVNELVTMNVANSEVEPEMRLVWAGGTCDEGYGAVCGYSDCSDATDCREGDQCVDGLCTNNRGNHGSCLGPAGARRCVYPVDGDRPVQSENDLLLAQMKRRYPETSCRAYPQNDAPFPSKVADPNGWNDQARGLNNGNPVLIGPRPEFQAANVCQRRFDPETGREYDSCECSYQIGSYSAGIKKYFSSEDSDLPSGYCQGGGYDGYECDPQASGIRVSGNLSCCTEVVEEGGFSSGECADGAQCRRLSKVERVVGYEGQCLEKDRSTPINGDTNELACVTWRPVGIVGGTRDIYNQNVTAGYFVPSDRRFYCVGDMVSGTLASKTVAAAKARGRVSSGLADNARTDKGDGNFFVNHLPGDQDLPIGWSIDIGIIRHEDDDWDKGLYDQTWNETIDVWDDPNIPGLNFDFEKDQVMNLFFAPATPSNFKPGFISHEDNCQSGSGGEFCIFPGSSEVAGTDGISDPDEADFCDPNVSNPCPSTDDGTSQFCYTCDPDDPQCPDGLSEDKGACVSVKPGTFLGQGDTAEGVLGCYEVADEGSVFETFIEHDYIGPTIYADQLVSLEFSITDDLYKHSLIENSSGSDDRAKLATNRGQDVFNDCNDEGNDNIDPESGTHIDIFHLTAGNDWSVDASDHQGTVLISAKFDRQNRLSSLRIAASDNKDEGAFGLEHFSFNFKPGCSEIIRVDEPGEFGLTTAYTDVLNSLRNFRVEDNDSFADGFPYDFTSYEQACRPYGAVGSITSVPPKDPPQDPWTYVTLHPRFEDGEPDPTGIEAPQQCTTVSFRRASGYEADDSGGEAAESIRKLFRKVTDAWSFLKYFSDSTKKLSDLLYNRNSFFIYDDTDSETSPSTGFHDGVVPPVVASLDPGGCGPDGHCSLGRLDALTINGRDEGVLSAREGVLHATISFYAWASHNAMPILKRTVLWGDIAPEEPPGKGWYKNSKPYCSGDISDEGAIGECTGSSGLTCEDSTDCPAGTGSCDGNEPNHFGNVPQACESEPARYQHTYTCGLRELQLLDECTGPDDAATNAPCRRDTDAGEGEAWACVYRPKVQILDNWGWCNCTGSGCRIPDAGAYSNREPTPDASVDECAITGAPADAQPWTLYEGEVRVFPTLDVAETFDPGADFSIFFGGEAQQNQNLAL